MNIAVVITMHKVECNRNKLLGARQASLQSVQTGCGLVALIGAWADMTRILLPGRLS